MSGHSTGLGSFGKIEYECSVLTPIVPMLLGVWISNYLGNQPSEEQVIQAHPQFNSLQDIEDTCVALQKTYSVSYQGDERVIMPISKGLCERQELVKQLLPGYCDGGCFSEENPPSCDLNDYKGTRNESSNNVRGFKRMPFIDNTTRSSCTLAVTWTT